MLEAGPRTITSHMDTLYNTLSREFETVVPLPSHPPAAAARMTNQLDPFSSSSAGAVAAAGSAGAGSGNTGAGSGGGAAFTREWEFGRAAYLSWAVSRARALVVVDSYDRGKNQHGSEGRGGGGGMDVDQEDGPGMITANTNTTSIKGTGTAGVGTDGEQKRLETLLAMTRGVSGGGAATSVGGTTTTTATGPADGVKGMGWALHGLSTKSDSSSAGVGAGGVGGGGAGAGGARGGGSSGA
ncbi:hypothetical protein QFC24_002900 [Naganishia onofrii]|uniref:Uncharacterized protein n=1 Tax=Naganishia onofrii TaxID=1851511 RepID=A0ACC2XMW8_9TREE|nr:hypothetical protein QFC24_002900 [Naganishia onofrii]